MSELTYTVSMPFKRKGKDSLKDMEFVMALSMDLKWFTPEQAKSVLAEAQRSGLLKREGDLVRPSFDISKIEIPSGFKPQTIAIEKKTVFESVIERIITKTGIEKRKVISMINKKQEELSKQVVIEVSALLVAIENGVTVDDLIDEEYAALTTLSF
jgi:hypothetical protein